MTRWSRLRARSLPWSGLIAAFLGWSLTHQIGSNTSFDRCGATMPLPMALLGLAGLALILVGGWLSFALSRREGEAATRRFIGLVCALAAGIFAMALVWQTASSLIIPQCYG